MRSMTGYGRGQSRGGGLLVDVEVSSVNRKQLDVQTNLSRALQVLEPRIQDEVGRQLSRGRVVVNVHVARTSTARARGLAVDESLARSYVEALRALAKKLNLKDDLGAAHLAAIPDIVKVEHAEEDADRLWPVLRCALAAALADLLRMREREGRALAKDLRSRFRAMAGRVAALRGLAPGVTRRYRDQLKARLSGLGAAPDEDERVLREIALFADRSDITEEITRLGSHIGQAGAIMKDGGAAGRPLDFLAQEMFREINTIGSKANDAAIAREVVDFKAELERVREQVQNIE